MKNHILILGEAHRKKNEIKVYKKLISQFKPDYLLHELLYDDICLTKTAIKERLNKCKIGYFCDPTLNKDIYQFAYNENIPIVGIDLPTINKNLSLLKQFQLRETRMLEIIKKYDMYRIAIVVGDTHLRNIVTKELGAASPIVLAYKNKAIIVRSNFKEIL